MREPRFYEQCVRGFRTITYCAEYEKEGCPKTCYYANERKRMREEMEDKLNLGSLANGNK